MPKITQKEIDNLPPPPKEWLIEIENDSKLNSKKQSNIIKDFWDNPVLLKTHQRSSTKYMPESIFYSTCMMITKQCALECIKQQGINRYEMMMENLNTIDSSHQKFINMGMKIKKELSNPIRNKRGNKFYFKEITNFIYPKGLSLKDYDYMQDNKFGVSFKDDSSKLLSIKSCFNIIQKEFKVLQITKKDFYTRYFTYEPFLPYEECGIEIMYARKGYAIDGKRLPNFNRGSVYGLKHSIKENNIKMKEVGGTKKDDLIKFLMKL